MSVICQNFVQNAWKKDLCSNCFKSVGDHEIGENGRVESPQSNPPKQIKIGYVSPATNGGCAPNGNATPHTTWKSLITDRNTKNSQPFNLETGFQGQVLTINKASNGISRNGTRHGSLKNGHMSDSELSSDNESRRSNGKVTVTGFSLSKQGNQFLNGFSLKNGNCRQQVNGKLNGTKLSSNGLKEFEVIASSIDKSYSSAKQMLIKSKSEDSLTVPLHSILKKTISSPMNHNQSRRSSNVGFKDEEPQVIGYGGRDFSPEDLQWDMNTSDCETETTSDSMDEDDKVFSKMTKKNTEFNADNTNLLETEDIASQSNLSDDGSIGNYSNPMSNDGTSQRTSSENRSAENGESKSKVSTNMLKKSDVFTTKPLQTDNLSTAKKDTETNRSRPSVCLESESVELDVRQIKNEENESGSVPMSREETPTPMTSGEVTIVGAAKVGSSRTNFKNNQEIERGASPLRAIPARHRQNGAMLAEGEESKAENNNLLPSVGDSGRNGWQESDAAAGQILQAINTSLTNRHKMNEARDAVNAHVVVEATSSGDNSAEKCTVETPASSDDDAVAEGEVSVTPRASFLHGTSKSEKQITKPSAIYGPASDLFVSRSSSSSSSSSSCDELCKGESTHSVNVIVSGAVCPQNDSENDDVRSPISSISKQDNHCSITIKTKPKLPAKPTKHPVRPPSKLFGRSKSTEPTPSASMGNSESVSNNGTYYSVSNASSTYSDGPKSITLVDHYAESNIYHEVVDAESRSSDEHSEKALPRETKLAALAMELEQARYCNGNTKRQAPAPPKVPEPPIEEPPSGMGRVSPSISDTSHGFSSFRGEVLGFSSSSSSASTSSQDTETGYGSWNLHGEADHSQRKHSKSSFLLTQYSKCKMLAKEYAEDKSRKRFSLKKLLKMKKDGSDHSTAFDPNCPNPKAWKYSDQFERPRAKLEIIHPMDLETKSVTVNPGFETQHSTGMSSFSASADDLLMMRNSVSSDYGSFYSDTISPQQELKPESNYERIPPPLPPPPDEQEDNEDKNDSNSPTPSRSSSVSQTSTVTSGSSKNSAASPHRPPKPPPPPRAHSLLPGNKTLNADGTFKFPIVNCNSVSGVEAPSAPVKPQAPKRQSRVSLQRSEGGIYDNTALAQTTEDLDISTQNISVRKQTSDEENAYGTILDIRHSSSEIPEPISLEPTFTCSQATPTEPKENVLVGARCDAQSINVTVKTNVTEPAKTMTGAVVTRSKTAPLTKAPARPPPIYMKSQIANIVKNPNPWKTLEDSYLTLTTSNRELLVKLVNQALKKRKNFLTILRKLKFQWSDFEIDVEQPLSVFAFGEKIAYHATMPKHPEYSVTLVVTVQQQPNRLNENLELKYPVFGQFVDFIPKELLENSTDAEIDSMQATILVLDRSNISTIECFTENLPDSLSEDNEKELCYIVIQLINSLKSLQAQGIESMDSSFQNLVMAKTKHDHYHTLIFLNDNCFDENDYFSDSCKISLCQYALLLLYHMLGIQSVDEFSTISTSRFASDMSRKIFETALSFLSEEKAVSLSQTKTLFECFLFDITKFLGFVEDSDDIDIVLQRWLDIKRATYVKSIVDDDGVCDINVMSECLSQFLLRSSIRNIKDVLSYL